MLSQLNQAKQNDLDRRQRRQHTSTDTRSHSDSNIRSLCFLWYIYLASSGPHLSTWYIYKGYVSCVARTWQKLMTFSSKLLSFQAFDDLCDSCRNLGFRSIYNFMCHVIRKPIAESECTDYERKNWNYHNLTHNL